MITGSGHTNQRTSTDELICPGMWILLLACRSMPIRFGSWAQSFFWRSSHRGTPANGVRTHTHTHTAHGHRVQQMRKCVHHTKNGSPNRRLQPDGVVQDRGVLSNSSLESTRRNQPVGCSAARICNRIVRSKATVSLSSETTPQAFRGILVRAVAAALTCSCCKSYCGSCGASRVSSPITLQSTPQCR